MKINFKFKKLGYKRLLLIDLDETLIHVRRENSDEGYYKELYNKDFDPDVEIPIYDPKSKEINKASFSVRPFVREFLSFSNEYFEVGIFTAGNQWFADKIIDYIDPEGKFV